MAITPAIRRLSVSPLLPSAGRLDHLERPADLQALGLTPRVFAGDFCDRHEDIGRTAPADHLVYYACAVKCSEPMRLWVIVGYDGPVKVWADGQELYHDPAGTNPASAHTGKPLWNAAAGSHIVLIALGTNSGRARGIFLHFRRLDVSAATLQRGTGAYAMPFVGPLPLTPRGENAQPEDTHP